MKVDLFKVYMPKSVDKKMIDVLHSGYIAEGEQVRLFESRLQNFFNNKNIITTNSCTSALHLSLKIAGVGFGDYVLVTPQTCVATCVSIANLGAIPVWVDVDPRHGMITKETLLDAISNIKDINKIKAVLYVLWGGDLGPISEIDKTCKDFKMPLIVDAAQGFGVRYNSGHNILGDGLHGDMVCFSFQAIKHITCSDGGAIAFRDQDLCKRGFKLKWFGIDRDGFRTPTGEINWQSDIPEIGFKFHMNNIAGVIGAEQMGETSDNLIRRLNSYILNDLILQESLEDIIKRSWVGPTAAWVSTFLVSNPLDLLVFLKEKGIHTSQMHINNDIYSGFKGVIKHNSLPGVKEFMDTHLCFPCGWWVAPDQLQYIIDSVREYYGTK